MLGAAILLVVVAVVAILLVVWIIGVIRKVSGCFIHLALAAAGLILFVYLTWLLWQRFLA